MTIFRYLKYKIWTIVAFILCAAIFIVTLILYGVPKEYFAYPILLCSVMGLVFVVCGYFRAKRKYSELEKISRMSLEIIDDFPPATKLGEEEYQAVIHNICDEAREKSAEHISRYNDMIDYYSMWAHQIKTPIASMRLNLQNEDSKLSRQLLIELSRIERYVDMVMTYLRLDSRDSDLVIREHELDDILKPIVRKLSNDFIAKGLGLKYEGLHCRAITDDKWLGFVIEQLLSNAVKYTNEGCVEIFMDEGNLCIKDSGIGIAPEDLPRVFEKGYTGFNGRIDKRASGIGLYLCKRICDKLGHKISIESQLGEGTVVKLRLERIKLGFE